MAINKYAKKILITREYNRTNARLRREIETGNIEDEEKRKGRNENICPNDDKDEENVIIA